MTERALGLRARERLSTNENEFGPAPEVLRAVSDAAGEAHRYPDCDHRVLREELASRLRTEPDSILVGSGVDGLLGATARTFLGPDRAAVTSEATYPTFGYFARAQGADLRLVPYRSGRVDLGALARAAHETRAAVVYLADPDNPTGSSHGAAAVLDLADALPAHTVLVVDGAYAEYQNASCRLTAGQVTARRILWLRTFSKAYALAGLRIGYAVGAPELLGTLARGAEHYVVGRVSEAAALAALDAAAHLSHVIEETTVGRAHYTAALSRLGMTVLPGTTNFVTARLPEAATARHLTDALARHGIFVRSLTAPGMTDCLRISIGPATQRAVVLAAIERALDHRTAVTTS
ncbi:aminotransferase class I/II-fold pyridoxal phosphate-dependent enzyme [Streptomyces luteolus]|uniref:Aminotransferase class I/II-fold pyridoxal phosphate-dependent enzyme n=1 Tax=Streptomyces luteolus TaxID=3043615 RepID=A0ABT6SW71_9ACTN|nr:aminotransferase class I/II-fold pyridoxal phosphate-dependent enzyme [Streptomyces sp. B-S-A12]MDI3419854.1 aminotransferase class I/II-fold pyridoxal phosphate-dependent enzyme [Streptomyces sp. B-S-A12]